MKMKTYYDEETAGLALVGCLGVCVLAGFVIIGLIMWGGEIWK